MNTTEANKKTNIQEPNKLLEFQKKVSAISKDSVNPFFKSKYFDVNTVIDTIKPILNEVGLVVMQPFDVDEQGRNVLATQVYDGEEMLAWSKIVLPEITDVQKFGATITYFRRYALVSLLLLQGEEDDDGNKVASKATKPTTAPNFEPRGIIEIGKDQQATDYKVWSDKIKNSKDEVELEGYRENLKYVSKAMKVTDVAKLRKEFKAKQEEFNPPNQQDAVEITMEDYPQ